MSLLRWLYWFFWESRIYKHKPGDWKMRNFGVGGEIRHCVKCGKCVDLI